MTNVVTGHFDSTASLHKQIESLCLVDGQMNNDRFLSLYAGAIAECILDYEDWKEGLDEAFNLSKPFEDALDANQWRDNGYGSHAFMIDKDTELGRSLVRPYLDDNAGTSYVMLRDLMSSLKFLMGEENDFWSCLYDMTALVLVCEQCVHTLCDQVIDICIGDEAWSLGDCVQALGGLSGQYYAQSLGNQELGCSKDAVINHGFDFMIHSIMSEAMRLGMPDHAGVYTMLPANDTKNHVPFRRSEAVDLIATPLFKIFKVYDSDLRSMMIAKATGRMMAVASAGDSADMDCCVVTPLALSSMQGTYNHCLRGAFHA
ncbi:MAG: hypothetical protein COB76_05415 [Alphaproteobacteria bacterium]|nr:MAG: hypothetical protein COB76_05415 [Alphaproteobacteria bacterium]